MQNNLCKTHFSTKTSQKHKVWGYIRRNRYFTFIDCMMATGVTENYLKTILWHLEKAGYIRQKSFKSIPKKRDYQHCMGKVFGVKSPSIVNGIVYDLNTNEEFNVSPTLVIEKMLVVMNENSLLTKEEIAKKARVTQRAAKKYYQRLETVNAISAATTDGNTNAKYLRRDNKKLFNINQKIVFRLLENIKQEKKDIWIVWWIEQ